MNIIISVVLAIVVAWQGVQIHQLKEDPQLGAVPGWDHYNTEYFHNGLSITGFATASVLRSDSTTGTSSVRNSLLIGTSSPFSAKLGVTDYSGALGSSYGMIRTVSTDSSGGNYELRTDSPQPDWEIIETDQTSPAGKYEVGVSGNTFYVASRDALDASFENIMQIDSANGSGNFTINSGDLIFASTTSNDIRSTTVFTTYPEAQASIGFRIDQDTTNLELSAVGSSNIEILDRISVSQGTNATSTMELGSTGQNKGSCFILYDARGNVRYAFIGENATSWTISAVACN